MNILHISDLHYSSIENYNQNVVVEALLSDIKAMQKKKGPISLVVFSGDLVFSGDVFEDFEKANEKFLNRILDACSLSNNNLVIVPGNHDISRSLIDKYSEVGYRDLLVDRDTVNQLLSKKAEMAKALERLNNFNRFFALLNPSNLISDNAIVRAYKFQEDGHSVGIVAINSSWRAKGGSEDYGKLLVGENHFLLGYNAIQDTSIKIGVMHHPIEWLQEFDRKIMKTEVFTKLDLLLVGHNHEKESISSTGPLHQRLVISNGGCLYQSRDFYNGYSLISLNFEEKKLSISHRTYFTDRQVFDLPLNYTDGEDILFEIGKYDGGEKISNEIQLYDEAQISLSENINQKLVLSALETIAPKELKNIFVFPKLVEQVSEIQQIEDTVDFEKTKKPPKDVPLNDIITDTSNYFIVGQKECGKTTILDYICLKQFENISAPGARLPIYLNCSNLTKGIKSIIKELKVFAAVNGFKFISNIEEVLEKGECCILIDDFDQDNQQLSHDISEFTRKFNKNKYIVAQASKPISYLLLKESEHLKEGFKRVLVKPWSKNSIEKLTSKWFGKSGVDTHEITEKTVTAIEKLNLPRTPVIISFVLWIFEKQENYTPLNKASVVEKFVEIILEKLSVGAERRMPDYRIKEHYLSFVAENISSSSMHKIQRYELERLTLDYFSRKKISFPATKFIDYFIEKGIFTLYDNMISFKLRCFREFFVAKQILEDSEYRNISLSEDRFLDIINEIDYATGLARNNTEILMVVFNKAQQVFDDFEKVCEELNLDIFEEINLEDAQSKTEGVDETKLLKSIKASKSSMETNAESLDEMLSEIPSSGTEEMKLLSHSKSDEQTIGSILGKALTLLSIVLKNTELIDFDLKKPILDKCQILWGKYLLLNILVSSHYFEDETLLKEKIKEVSEATQNPSPEADDSLDEEEMKEVNKLIKYFMALFIERLYFDFLGSPTFEQYLKNSIENKEEKAIIRFLSLFMYGELKLPHFVDLLKKYLKSVSKYNRDILMLIYYNIYQYYLTRPRLESTIKAELEKILVDLFVTANNQVSDKRKGVRLDTSKLYDEIRKSRIRVDSMKEKSK